MGMMPIKKLLQPTAWKKFLFFFLSDIILFYLSLLLALLFHFDLNLNIRYNPLIFPVLPFFVVVKIGFFFIFRIYKMTWRYVGLYDFLSIMRNVRSEERGVRSEKGRYGTIEIV